MLAGDSSGNAQVDLPDFIELNNNFNTIGGSILGPGDLDANGDVNLSDFILLNNTFNHILFALAMDFGDAPESGSYPTTLANNGARHILGSELYLGLGVDGESNGQPDASATGDDNAADDEDGVTFATLQAGTNAGVTVAANVPSGTPVLNAWIDFNADGDWDDAGEQIFVDQTLTGGTNNLTAAIPSGATAGSTFARFRITHSPGYAYFGLAPDGEDENYQVTLVAAEGSANRIGPSATFNLWAAAFIAQPGNPQMTKTVPHRNVGETVWNRIEPTTTQVVDLAIVEVTSAKRTPSSISEGSSSLDGSLVDQVLGEETDLVESRILNKGFRMSKSVR